MPRLEKIFHAYQFIKCFYKLFSHNNINLYDASPPRVTLPILQKLIMVYRTWHEYIRHFPKDFRYSLGTKIDSLFLEVIEAIFMASILIKGQKLPHIQKASIKLDMLKFFLQVAWESKAIDNKRYITFSSQLAEIGRMLGGWQKQIINIEKGNPAKCGE